MQLVHQARPVTPRERLIRLTDVESIAGCKKSTIYQMMAAGNFPKPVKLNRRAVAWPETAVLKWVQDRIEQVQQQDLIAPDPVKERKQ